MDGLHYDYVEELNDVQNEDHCDDCEEHGEGHLDEGDIENVGEQNEGAVVIHLGVEVDVQIGVLVKEHVVVDQPHEEDLKGLEVRWDT